MLMGSLVVLLGGEFLVFLLRHLLNQGGVGLLRFLGLVLDAVDWKEFFGVRFVP